MPSTNNTPTVYFKEDSDPSPEDDIYIDCKPVDEIGTEETNSDNTYSQFNGTLFNDISNTNINIFDNVGFQSLLAVGIFAVILVSGNYVFNTIPNNRLEKAINKERFS